MKLTPRAEEAFDHQDYSPAPRIEGVELVELRRFQDDGGSITELGRLEAGLHGQLEGFEVKQINFSEIAPGVVKAYHMHRRQTDVWYVPPSSKLLAVLHDCRADSPTEGQTMRVVLGHGTNRLLRIPPGVAHGCTNLADATGHLIYMVDLQFSAEPDQTDEGRLPWDYLGAEIWQMVNG